MTAIVLMAIQFTFAVEPAKKFATEEQKIAFATTNLLAALRSNNPGLIESAMRITAQMKMRYPAVNVSELISAINKVWQKHPSGSTRYKAYIAMSICENPEWYASEESIVAANDETFFRAASNYMNQHFLSANVK